MPRSRSRERERRNRSRDRDRRSRSRSRDKRKSRDRTDYKRRDRSTEKYSSSSSRRDKYDGHRRRSRDRSYDKSHRDRSSERDRQKKRRDSRDRRRSSSRSRRHRSDSSDRKTSHSSRSQSKTVKPIVIIANHNSKKTKHNRNQDNEAGTSNSNAHDHRASFEISNEFSQEGFEQFSRDHGIDFTKIETDEDREAVHEKMEELLKAHFAAQGKVYPPPKQEKPVVNNVTGFANDGSFLEQFKKMQEEYKQQTETDVQKQQTIVNNLKNLPINKRRGGKILKTGLVAKTIVTSEGTITTNAYDSYYKEVQKYKNSSSCDSDSKTRPLVK